MVSMLECHTRGFKDIDGRPIVFIYKGKHGTCTGLSIHRKLHGREDVRTSKDDNGRTYPKTYSYGGIRHYDIVPGVFAVSVDDARVIVSFFIKHSVPYVRIDPSRYVTRFWRVAGDNQKPP